MKLNHVCTALLTAGLLYSASSFAVPVVLDFEGPGNNVSVLNFYYASYGVTFSSNALALIDSDSGGSGNFANEPSPSTIMYFKSQNIAGGNAVVMNRAQGFDTLSFYYSSFSPATVNVYDGPNSSGNVLKSVNLPAQAADNNCGGDPTGALCNWTFVPVSFNGIAMSVEFGGEFNGTAYDNVTFCEPNGCTAVPEPASLALLGLGLAGLGFGRRKRA